MLQKQKKKERRKTFVQVYLMKSECYLYKYVVTVIIILQASG